MAAKAYDWLKAVQTELVQKKELTYSGAPKGFAWETLSQKLGARFQLPDLVIQGSDPEWGSQERPSKESRKEPLAPLICLRESSGPCDLLST